MPNKAELVVEGKKLSVSNLEKVLYPATGFTKQQVIDYYVRIAPAIIPHLAGRALTRNKIDIVGLRRRGKWVAILGRRR